MSYDLLGIVEKHLDGSVDDNKLILLMSLASYELGL